jgi:hypothetical protein
MKKGRPSIAKSVTWLTYFHIPVKRPAVMSALGQKLPYIGSIQGFRRADQIDSALLSRLQVDQAAIDE